MVNRLQYGQGRTASQRDVSLRELVVAEPAAVTRTKDADVTNLKKSENTDVQNIQKCKNTNIFVFWDSCCRLFWIASLLCRQKNSAHSFGLHLCCADRKEFLTGKNLFPAPALLEFYVNLRISLVHRHLLCIRNNYNKIHKFLS